MFLNADLIESIESTPDTVVTLADGRRMVLSDSPEEVVAAITEFRASILAAADQLRTNPLTTASPDGPADVIALRPAPEPDVATSDPTDAKD